MKEPAVPLLAGLLVAVTLPAAFGAAVVPWPTTPTALAAAALVLVVVWVAVALPSTRHARPVSVLEALLVSAPLGSALWHAAVAPVVVPWPFVSVGVGLGVLACATAAPWRGRIVTIAACVLAGVPALAAAGVIEARSAPRPPTSPLAIADLTARYERASAADLVPLPWRVADPRRPLRVGALAMSPPSSAWGSGPPPWAAARWIPVPDGSAADLPRGSPVARFIGAAALPPSALGISTVTAPLTETDARDLDACDVVVLGSDAPDDATLAAVLAGFVRRGGLLVGPAPASAWPPTLARRLGPSASDDAGPAGARTLDAGHVARAAGPEAFASLLAAGLHRPRVATAFDRATAAPPAPPGFSRGSSDVERERTPLGTGVAATAALGLVAWLVRGRRRTAWLAALAAVGVIEPALARGADPAPTVEAFALEMGGAGARRVDGIFVSAGPAGWVSAADPVVEGDGLRVLGFVVVRVDGAWRLALEPGASGWVVAERSASGAVDGGAEVESPPAWAMALLERPSGAGVSGRVVVGTSAVGVRWPGLSVPTVVRAVAVRLRGG